MTHEPSALADPRQDVPKLLWDMLGPLPRPRRAEGAAVPLCLVRNAPDRSPAGDAATCRCALGRQHADGARQPLQRPVAAPPRLGTSCPPQTLALHIAPQLPSPKRPDELPLSSFVSTTSRWISGGSCWGRGSDATALRDVRTDCSTMMVPSL